MTPMDRAEHRALWRTLEWIGLLDDDECDKLDEQQLKAIRGSSYYHRALLGEYVADLGRELGKYLPRWLRLPPV